MGRITKYSKVIESRILELYAQQWSLTKIAYALRVSRNTLHRWIRVHALQDRLDSAREELMRDIIRSSTLRLAQGVRIEEETIKTIEEDDAGRPIERTLRIKELPPSEKALNVLAKRYDKEFGDASNDTKQVTHDINVNVMSMRDLSKLNELHNPLGDITLSNDEYSSTASDAADILSGSDILEDTSNAVHPPERDSDDE